LKKIIRKRYRKEYNISPVFEDFVTLPYPDDKKVEMFCGERIQGYLLDQRLLTNKIN
jgi:hypothetical protein